MKLFIHKREVNIFTDVLVRELPKVGLMCHYVENLSDIPAATDEKHYLLMSWPHLFYHSPLEEPRWLPSLRRWEGWRYRLWQLRRRGVDVVWLLHNIMPHNQRLAGMDSRIRRYLVSSCKGIIALCNDSLEQLQERTGKQPKNQAVFPFPPLHDLPWILPEKNAARLSLSIPSDSKVFLSFGLFRRYKGYEDLITYFKSLPERNLHLTIMGRPTMELTEQDLLDLKGDDERIHIIARVYREEELAEWLAATDWVVLPYRNITNSGVAMTALNGGCAIIAPRLGCLPTQIPPGAGILYDAGGLKPALEKTLTLGEEEMSAMRKVARESYRQSDIRRSAEAIKAALEGFV
jgi:glycosyltransferase involved in cell wall biosynthesis